MKSFKVLAREIRYAHLANLGFLHTLKGKQLLKATLKFNPSWPEFTKLFGRSRSTLEKALSFHGIRKLRPRYLNWSDASRKMVEKYYAESQAVRDRAESGRLSDEMVAEVNRVRAKEGLSLVTKNAIRCFACDLNPPLKWGWCSWEAGKLRSGSNGSIEEDINWLRSI